MRKDAGFPSAASAAWLFAYAGVLVGAVVAAGWVFWRISALDVLPTALPVSEWLIGYLIFGAFAVLGDGAVKVIHLRERRESHRP